VDRFLSTPGAPGFSMWHDDRPRASRVGVLFTVTATLVMLFGLWLTWRAVRRRGEERRAS
jgi:ABC-type nickel/cobalt efflux system permease component RcnA